MTDSLLGLIPEEKTIDEVLVKQWREGDKCAGPQLFRNHHEPLWEFVCRLTAGDIHMACDVTQETWWRFFQRILDKGFTEWGGGVRAFLFKTAKNVCIDFRRKKPMYSLQDIKDTIKDENKQAENIAKIENEELISLAMSKLSDTQRRAIELRYYDGLRFEEISAALRVSIGKAHNLVSEGIVVLSGLFRQGDKAQ